MLSSATVLISKVLGLYTRICEKPLADRGRRTAASLEVSAGATVRMGHTVKLSDAALAVALFVAFKTMAPLSACASLPIAMLC